MAKQQTYTVYLSDAVLRALLSNEQSEYEFTYHDAHGGYGYTKVVVRRGTKLPEMLINKTLYKAVRIDDEAQ